MSGRRLDVTATQAVSSLLAALTGAIAASGLGIAGTLIGAAFMSLASTVGAAVYKHYIGRSHERLRAVAANRAPQARGSAVAAAFVRLYQASRVAAFVRRHRASRPAGAAQVQPDSQARAAAAPDLVETAILPALTGDLTYPTYPATRAWTAEPAYPGDLDLPTRDLPTRDLVPPGQASDVSRGSASATAEVPDGAGSAAGTGTAAAAGAGQDDGEDATGAWWRWSRRKWVTLAAVALGIFIVTMGVVTAFEAIAGKPLETVVWHRPGSGTTIGGLVGGHSKSHHPKTRPSSSPSPTSSSGSPRPSSSPTSPSPTTSPSGSSGPASSTSPAATGSP